MKSSAKEANKTVQEYKDSMSTEEIDYFKERVAMEALFDYLVSKAEIEEVDAKEAAKKAEAEKKAAAKAPAKKQTTKSESAKSGICEKDSEKKAAACGQNLPRKKEAAGEK